MSVSGGLYKAVERIMQVDGQALQIFTRNQRQWKALPVSDDEALLFSAAWERWGSYPVAVHASYLINMATPDVAAGQKAITALAEELVRTEKLGIQYVVLHPGATVSGSAEEGCARAAKSVACAMEQSGTQRVTVLLENTAGQGTTLGADFAELGEIIARSGVRDRIGMCLDTAHAFEAGYDLQTEAGYAHTFATLERCVGLDKLLFMHLNDSKTALGSRVDRHEHIGKGLLGEHAFIRLVNDSRFATLPMVLETPKDETLEDDRRNLSILRSFVGYR